MFTGMARLIRKGKIKAEVQSELQEQAVKGHFNLDAFAVSASLVDSMWKAYSDVFDGQRGAKPNNNLIAVAVLGAGLRSDFDWGQNRDGLTLAFLSACSKLNQPSHRFSQIDMELMEQVTPLIRSLENELESSSLAQELEQLMGGVY